MIKFNLAKGSDFYTYILYIFMSKELKLPHYYSVRGKLHYPVSVFSVETDDRSNLSIKEKAALHWLPFDCDGMLQRVLYLTHRGCNAGCWLVVCEMRKKMHRLTLFFHSARSCHVILSLSSLGCWDPH